MPQAWGLEKSAPLRPLGGLGRCQLKTVASHLGRARTERIDAAALKAELVARGLPADPKGSRGDKGWRELLQAKGHCLPVRGDTI